MIVSQDDECLLPAAAAEEEDEEKEDEAAVEQYAGHGYMMSLGGQKVPPVRGGIPSLPFRRLPAQGRSFFDGQ